MIRGKEHQRESRDRLVESLREVNRHRRDEGTSAHSEAATVVETRYRASSHLAIYGSLAPGQPNHGMVAPLRGEWIRGVVRGHLHNAGWGSKGGYPGMTWNPSGEPLAVNVLRSDQLASHWLRLDEFEGDDYRRILVPVETEEGELIVANIYELKDRV